MSQQFWVIFVTYANEVNFSGGNYDRITVFEDIIYVLMLSSPNLQWKIETNNLMSSRHECFESSMTLISDICNFRVFQSNNC